MTNPLISVVIPVYNCEKYIKSALESVFKQNYHNLEVIVIDDGSTDNSVEVVKDYNQNIKIISQSNKGPASARNKGIQSSRGEFICFIDADDLWTDNHLEILLSNFNDNEFYHTVRGNTEVIKIVDGKITKILDKIITFPLIGDALYRSSVFEIVGLFNESMSNAEDTDWFDRLKMSVCKEKKIDEITLYYHRHENNMTNNLNKVKKGFFDLIRKKMQRNEKNNE